MGAWFFISPFIAGCIGWLVVSLALKMIFYPLHPKTIMGFTLQGLLPKKQAAIAAAAGKLSASIISIAALEEKITHPENVKKIMPHAEEHIDHFLRVKLVKSMPVVGMFVGDKTINNLKALFVTELEQLFPEIMKNYIGQVKEDFDIEKIVAIKIHDYPPSEIASALLPAIKGQLNMIKWMGAALCFFVSFLQALLSVMIMR